jgi:hypothetical protein
MGSKGCIDAGSAEEMSWNNVRLFVTKNGVATVKNLAGGIERMEEHLNSQLTQYKQQGWQPVKVEIPQENSQTRYLQTTIHCLLKRSIRLEPSTRLNQLSKNSTKIYQTLSIGA